MIKDINRAFSETEESVWLALRERFSDSVERILQEDSSKIFEACGRVFCPAVSAYFRIWNNGDIQDCTNISQLAHCEDVKSRKVFV